jgi:hypothetical protein
MVNTYQSNSFCSPCIYILFIFCILILFLKSNVNFDLMRKINNYFKMSLLKTEHVKSKILN